MTTMNAIDQRSAADVDRQPNEYPAACRNDLPTRMTNDERGSMRNDVLHLFPRDTGFKRNKILLKILFSPANALNFLKIQT